MSLEKDIINFGYEEAIRMNATKQPGSLQFFRYIITPGHGYLFVSQRRASELGFVPTQYSYETDNMLYLEEDCDMPAFLWLYKKETGNEYELLTQHQEIDFPRPGMSRCPDQSMPSTYELWRESDEVQGS